MSVTQLLFDTAYVFDGSVDAVDGEMAEASVDTIFELPIEVPNLPPRTLDRVLFAGHRVHEGVGSERDGVSCRVLSDADVVIIWKYKAQLVNQ
eukprot:580589-Pleurochrysis_carterae.AAC.1